MIGPFAIFSALLSLFSAFGLYKWIMLPVENRHFDHNFWSLLARFFAGIFFFWLLSYVAARVLRATNFTGYDSRDPSQPFLK
jgi:hypothetical protein